MIETTKQIRFLIGLFIAGLFISGLTAIPLESGLEFLGRMFPVESNIGSWLDEVYVGIHEMNRQYPFLFYGYDWLAFAHFVLAILFIGPYKDPVKNKWVIEFGLIACLLIIPFALVAGHFRGIPLWWRLIDCSFGLGGMVPLLVCLKLINKMETNTNKNYSYETFD
jgi:hypothetical protein